MFIGIHIILTLSDLAYSDQRMEVKWSSAPVFIWHCISQTRSSNCNILGFVRMGLKV